MIEAVKKFIDMNNLTGKTILVGFSGGIDSSCMLDILSKIDDIKVVAIHLNHNWRGDESKRDEDFAKSFAKKRNIEFYSEILKDDIKKTETSAREERYKFFENCKNKFMADAVFLAHNKNDNVETLIYRLIKGTGPNGLNSIPEIRDFYYRPLINFSRKEIENYIKDNNVEYILDSSNSNKKYKRNLIRQDILPKMAEINPEVVEAISNFIKINKMNQQIIEKSLIAAENDIKQENFYNREKFLNLSKPLKYEIINRLLKDKIKTRDYKTIEKAVNFIQDNNSSKLSIGKNLFLKAYNNKIYLTEIKARKKRGEILLKEGKNVFENYKITVEKAPAPEKFPNKENSVQYIKLDFDKKYVLRTRMEGDKIKPFGSLKLQKLKTYFIKNKIEEEIRSHIPMIAYEDEILYIPNICISEKLRVGPKDKNCYKITVKKGK